MANILGLAPSQPAAARRKLAHFPKACSTLLASSRTLARPPMAQATGALRQIQPAACYTLPENGRSFVTRARFAEGAVTILMCVLMVTSMSFACSPATMDPAPIERRLRDEVPLQSAPSAVLAYLDRSKIEHSAYLRETEGGNSIRALIRERSRLTFVTSAWTVVFRFDDDDRLARFEIKREYTGP
jgi:hypothetical protein